MLRHVFHIGILPGLIGPQNLMLDHHQFDGWSSSFSLLKFQTCTKIAVKLLAPRRHEVALSPAGVNCSLEPRRFTLDGSRVHGPKIWELFRTKHDGWWWGNSSQNLPPRKKSSWWVMTDTYTVSKWITDCCALGAWINPSMSGLSSKLGTFFEG